MRILLAGDVHLSRRPPSSCTDSYCDDLFELLGLIAVKARELQADAIVIAGDLFHHKAPSRTSHELVQRVIRWARSCPCRVFVVPGNHDIQNDRLESLGLTQPLGVLFESEAVVELSGRWLGQLPLYGVPWQQEWSDEAVFTALADYRDLVIPQPGIKVQDVAGEITVGAYPGTTPPLVVAHAPLYPPGQELQYEYYPAAKWAAAMGNRGWCFYGHVHESHGIWECDGVIFCNFGALSRGSLHEHNLTRQVSATLWMQTVKSDGASSAAFSVLPLDARPAEQVFRLAEAGEIKDTQGRLDAFLAGISGTTLQVVTIEGINETVRNMVTAGQVTGPAAKLIEDLLEGASA